MSRVNQYKLISIVKEAHCRHCILNNFARLITRNKHPRTYIFTLFALVTSTFVQVRLLLNPITKSNRNNWCCMVVLNKFYSFVNLVNIDKCHLSLLKSNHTVLWPSIMNVDRCNCVIDILFAIFLV
jgi:hypothetical protein